MQCSHEAPAEMRNTKPCRILELPRELRDHIYDFVFDSDNYCKVLIVGESTRMEIANFKIQGIVGNDQITRHRALDRATALLKTCKQINEEANPLLQDSILFDVVVTGKYVGNTGQVIEDVACCPIFQYMRKVQLELKVEGMMMSLFRTEKVEDAVKPLLRNIDVFQDVVRQHKHIKIKTIDLDLSRLQYQNDFERPVERVVAALELLECRGEAEVYNKSIPREVIPSKSLSRLVERIGGKECTIDD